MKKILMMLACTALNVALFGCGGGGGGSTGNGNLGPVTTPAAKYAGIYSGTFTGLPGHWTKWRLNVNGGGTYSGHTDNDIVGSAFSGTISEIGNLSSIDETFNTATGAHISITNIKIDDSGNVTGTWVLSNNSSKTGTITGAKVTIPDLRFVDNHDGTITDAVTNLIWLKNANCFNVVSRVTGESNVSTLAGGGACGLADGSTAGMWRLPTYYELLIFVNDGYLSDKLNSSGFSNVASDSPYWANLNAFLVTDSWQVDMTDGSVSQSNIGNQVGKVWPVRTKP
ncbi:MAG TPA: DUF1566 domain-containing protein [Dongiaceae bacterium]|nr:DUF1566 domain-containing protein [Dongiaceae bacterium]